MPMITPCLWFDDQAEAAATLYVSIIPNSRIVRTTPYPPAAEAVSGKPAGSVLTVEFELAGQRFVALNGGPEFPHTAAVSFMVACQTQAEVDQYWARLSEGGEAGPCGWLKDRFGLSWQIVPARLDELLQDADPDRVNRVTAALLQMTKLDIQALETAAAQT